MSELYTLNAKKEILTLISEPALQFKIMQIDMSVGKLGAAENVAPFMILKRL